MSEKKKCSIEGCERTGNIEGLCYRHYREKYGHPYKPGKKRAKRDEGTKKLTRQKPPEKIKHKAGPPYSEHDLKKAQEEKTNAMMKKFSAEARHWELRARHLERQLMSRQSDPSLQNHPPDAGQNKPAVIQVDFTGHSRLYNEIVKSAKRTIRSVEGEILAVLKFGISIIARPVLVEDDEKEGSVQ